MRRPLSDGDYLRRLHGHFEAVQPGASGELHPALGALADGSDYLEAVLEWLKDLRLLKGVPFNHLVADSNLLPQESIRFFQVDQNWLNALLDGAMSVGSQSQVHLAMQRALQPAVLRESRARAPMLRRRLLGFRDEDSPPVADQWCGFLLRSSVVQGCPGLEVTAFQDMTIIGSGPDYAGSNPLQLLRMDRLAPDVMLCVFNGVPAMVQVNEPLEGLAFGVQDSGAGAGAGQFQLRGLGEPASDGTVYWQAGQQVTDSGGANVYAPVPWRDQAVRTVDVGALVASLPGVLQGAKVYAPGGHFGPGGFALQMLSLPEQKKFFDTGKTTRRTGTP